jgi:hypothetical protein
LLDLAAVLPSNDLAVAIDRAERQRLFDLTAVNEILGSAKGKRGAAALRAAIAAYEPSTQKSKLERRFRRLIEPVADIPSPSAFNAITHGEQCAHEVDALWEATGSPSRSTASTSIAPVAIANGTPRRTPTSSSPASGCCGSPGTTSRSTRNGRFAASACAWRGRDRGRRSFTVHE